MSMTPQAYPLYAVYRQLPGHGVMRVVGWKQDEELEDTFRPVLLGGEDIHSFVGSDDLLGFFDTLDDAISAKVRWT